MTRCTGSSTTGQLPAARTHYLSRRPQAGSGLPFGGPFSCHGEGTLFREPSTQVVGLHRAQHLVVGSHPGDGLRAHSDQFSSDDLGLVLIAAIDDLTAVYDLPSGWRIEPGQTWYRLGGQQVCKSLLGSIAGQANELAIAHDSRTMSNAIPDHPIGRASCPDEKARHVGCCHGLPLPQSDFTRMAGGPHAAGHRQRYLGLGGLIGSAAFQ